MSNSELDPARRPLSDDRQLRDILASLERRRRTGQLSEERYAARRAALLDRHLGAPGALPVQPPASAALDARRLPPAEDPVRADHPGPPAEGRPRAGALPPLDPRLAAPPVRRPARPRIVRDPAPVVEITPEPPPDELELHEPPRHDEVAPRRVERRPRPVPVQARRSPAHQPASSTQARGATDFDQVQRGCPVALVRSRHRLPGGLTWLPQEYGTADRRELGIALLDHKKLAVTTHRLIWWVEGVAEGNRVVSLAAIGDVSFQRPLGGVIGRGVVETTGGHRLDPLPRITNPTAFRSKLLALAAWARTGAAEAGAALPVADLGDPAPSDTMVSGDIEGKLRRLKQIHDSGFLSDAEYDAKRAELIERL